MKSLALFSLTHKENSEIFAKILVDLNFEIISTGGTANYLKSKNIPITSLENLTDFPEILDGRVKTLHPKIHGGILADWANPDHVKTCETHQIKAIRCLYINLYDFENTIQKPNLEIKDAIESIDIGGPSMIRGAAKNFKNCLILTSKEQFKDAKLALEAGFESQLFLDTALKFSQKAFELCSSYDSKINHYLKKILSQDLEKKADGRNLVKEFLSSTARIEEPIALKYGENPHQSAFLLPDPSSNSFLKQIHGPELSYNNILDLDAGIGLCRELKQSSCVIIKHNNPCGVAVNTEAKSSLSSVNQTIQLARSCDPLSAFGGIAVCSGLVDKDTALSISDLFLECIAAFAFTEEALDILRKKSKLRILTYDFNQQASNNFKVRKVFNGWLLQEDDEIQNQDSVANWQLVTNPSDAKKENSSFEDLESAWITSKHIKSNAILLWKNRQAIGVGPGQTSRIESAEIAFHKACKNFGKEKIRGSILASDAFLPFADTVELAAQYGVSTIIQPGGSIRDAESIAACEVHKISMYFTKIRHFRH